MDRKQMCIANIQYKKPTANEAKRTKELLRYLTYRESRDESAPDATGRERWENHGMGGSVAEIAERCEALQSKHVLLFSLVYNVNPDLIAMVAPDEREQFVRELTVNTTESFFEERGIDTDVEYAFVLHHRQTDDPESPGRHDPHTHVVLPGTYYYDGLGERVPLYFSKNQAVNHIDMLSTPELTRYGIHAKRGQEALNALNLVPRFTGELVHDGWRPYAAYSQ